MTAESWEYESKENIEICLNCTLPVEMCGGLGKCHQQNTRRLKAVRIKNEILKMALEGKNRSNMSIRLNMNGSTVAAYIKQMVKEGMMSEELAKKTLVYKGRKK